MTHSTESRYAGRMDPRSLHSQIGEAVRRRRDALKISLRGAAATSGSLSHSAIGHVETGISNATINMLAQIASALDARWEVRLIGSAEAARSPERQALLDRLDAMIDLLDDRDVRHLGGMLALYEADLGADRQSRK